jgi:hypothetical protein
MEAKLFRLQERQSFFRGDNWEYSFTKVGQGPSTAIAKKSVPKYEFEMELLNNSVYIDNMSTKELVHKLHHKCRQLIMDNRTSEFKLFYSKGVFE